jgi:cyclopropane fatty-acyl-phospholipid synthase-like methyltransferase
MSSAIQLETPQAPSIRPWRTVVNCYSVVDRFFPACGLYDLTEGIYDGDATAFDEAQANQHNYLLDQVRCEPERRVLDIGCGYGTLLERARQRGAAGVGITVAPQQLRHCRARGLNVHLLDYRAIPPEWDRTFDAVIANGSIEHFVRVDDVVAGRADDVYRQLFATVHRLIDPYSQARRFATTTIHFVRKPSDPRNMLLSPLAFRRGSDEFHWAVLEQGWGGYYPVLGQLERCAERYFDLVDEVDGTEDYRRTSEERVAESSSPRIGLDQSLQDRTEIVASAFSSTQTIPHVVAGGSLERVVELAVPATRPSGAFAASDVGLPRPIVNQLFPSPLDVAPTFFSAPFAAADSGRAGGDLSRGWFTGTATAK